MSEFREYLDEQLQDPDFKVEYDALEEEFATIQEMIEIREPRVDFSNGAAF